MTDAPLLDGIHHLKLPVTDLERSLAWYQHRLGYVAMKEFIEDGVRMGVVMRHANGGPDLALRLDPDRARAAAGFDYFAIGVPGHDAIDALATRFCALGDSHAGVMRTPVGWVLPGVHDPDGTRCASTPSRWRCRPRKWRTPDPPLGESSDKNDGSPRWQRRNGMWGLLSADSFSTGCRARSEGRGRVRPDRPGQGGRLAHPYRPSAR